MFTGNQRRVLLLAGTILLCAIHAEAHPVAQGALAVTILPAAIQVVATVSLEEILVENSYGSGAAAGRSLAAAGQAHGAYLLDHIRVSADGNLLSGKLLRVGAPDSPDLSRPAKNPRRYRYEFEFPLAKPVTQLRIEENVLNEFDFAPGNRWEASYIIQIAEGKRPLREGLLLTSRQPLTFACDEPRAPSRGGNGLDRWQVVRDYLHHGILHILTGYDHLLFVTALVLTVRSLWELAKVISAFTLAHSITLALSAFDIVRLPSHVVEPMIAASIVFVAVQNIFWPEKTRGWSRLGIAFFFGLFHGLGFAGGLLDAMQGMATHALVVALIGFSAGVEIGHQIVVLPTFFALKFARRSFLDPGLAECRAQLFSRWGSAAISIAGMVYLFAALRWW